MRLNEMLKLGLTGGIAAGKSVVGEMLVALGAHLIQADAISHQMMQPGEAVYQEVVRVFGPGILNPDATINRRALAAEVFDKPGRLEKLNSFVHPPVRARTKRLMEEFFQREPNGIAVSEAAILIETGSAKNYDRLIVAVCSEEQQIERAMARDHLTREEVLGRLRRQMPLAEKVRYADYVIDTSGIKEHTIEQTRKVFESLRSLSQCDSER